MGRAKYSEASIVSPGGLHSNCYKGRKMVGCFASLITLSNVLSFVSSGGSTH